MRSFVSMLSLTRVGFQLKLGGNGAMLGLSLVGLSGGLGDAGEGIRELGGVWGCSVW